MDECKCKLATKLVGDGCHACNPAYAYEMSVLTIKDLEVERDTLAKALEVAENLLRSYRALGWGSDKYIAKTLYHENVVALSEIERIKGEK
jgi:RecA/RadA recombinase